MVFVCSWVLFLTLIGESFCLPFGHRLAALPSYLLRRLAPHFSAESVATLYFLTTEVWIVQWVLNHLLLLRSIPLIGADRWSL